MNAYIPTLVSQLRFAPGPNAAAAALRGEFLHGRPAAGQRPGARQGLAGAEQGRGGPHRCRRGGGFVGGVVERGEQHPEPQRSGNEA